MRHWTQVDWDELTKDPCTEEIHGVHIDTFFSPYDMPEAVSGEYDGKRNRFVILFRYLGGAEKVRRMDIDEHVCLGIGAKSHRLHEIAVDVGGLRAQHVSLSVESLTKNALEFINQSGILTPTANCAAISSTMAQPPVHEELERELQSI